MEDPVTAWVEYQRMPSGCSNSVLKVTLNSSSPVANQSPVTVWVSALLQRGLRVVPLIPQAVYIALFSGMWGKYKDNKL